MKVIITDHGFPNVNHEQRIVEAAGHTLEVKQCKTEQELIQQVTHADVLLVQWAPMTRTVIEALKNCKVIVRYGIGLDNVDLDAAAEHGVPVCNVPDYCIDEVADHTMAMALALSRQLTETQKQLLNGTWSIVPPVPIKASREMTFGTAGFGRIAREVLQRAKAFKFRCIAYDPFVEAAVMQEAGVEKVTDEELFEQADILSLHTPLTQHTHHFVNADRLLQMKPDAILVNTSRGGLIDTKALATAINNGRLSGAGIDVYEPEPLEESHPLRQCDRVILTSHTAWNSTQSVPKLQQLAAEEAVRALNGEGLKNQVTV